MAIQIGPASKHITKSLGPDSNLNKFYITQYSSSHGRRWEKFLPRTTRHAGSGYVSNIRPQIFYTRQLDQKDNPAIGAIVSHNYHTTTELAFRPYTEKSVAEPFPLQTHQTPSGYTREEGLNIPTRKQVDRPFIDRIAKQQFADTLPRHVPLLHRLRGQNPVENENTRYGPGYMTTENKERYQGLPTDHVNTAVKSVGKLTESGFVHNHNIEPITFHPDFAHKNDQPQWMTNRPIDQSVMKTTFLKHTYPTGREIFGEIPNGSNRGSGFTNNPLKPEFFLKPSEAYDKAGDIPGPHLEKLRKKDPVEFINTLHPHGSPSVTKYTYTGQQRPSNTMPDLLDRTSSGTKSDTGFVENNPRFVQVAEDPGRFLTETKYRFKHPDAHLLMTTPYVRGGVQEAKSNAYVISADLHSKALGRMGDTTKQLSTLEPYVARSIKARDVFHDDHTYDHKTRKFLSFYHQPHRTGIVTR